MRASEARQKLCHLGFSGNVFVRCRADECMAWSVYRAAGSKFYSPDHRLIADGFEVDPDAPKRVGYTAIRTTEDHGECYALPARPE